MGNGEAAGTTDIESRSSRFRCIVFDFYRWGHVNSTAKEELNDEAKTRATKVSTATYGEIHMARSEGIELQLT